jgi:hypothetical protein
VLVLYVCFAYPSGYIDQRSAARLLASSAVAMAVLLAANLLLSNVEPVAGPFVRCSGSECPSNPFNIVDIGQGAGKALSTGLALVTAVSLAGAAVLIAVRAVRSTPLQRRSLAPLLAWAALAAVGYAFFLSVRAVDDHAPLLTPAAVATAAIIAAMPLAIALGFERGRVFAMGALEHMMPTRGFNCCSGSPQTTAMSTSTESRSSSRRSPDTGRSPSSTTTATLSRRSCTTPCCQSTRSKPQRPRFASRSTTLAFSMT